MNYIEAPVEFDGNGPAIFLAGGISDAQDWQSRLTRMLGEVPATILNPRRKHFPMGDRLEGERQIDWEHRHLARASLVAFWFPPETVCPIGLFELGACCASAARLAVGTDPEYARRFDVVEQLRLRRPEVRVVDSLAGLRREIVRRLALSEETS